MPYEKKWVVDEKGFHVKSTWKAAEKTETPVEEPAPASKEENNND